MQARSDRLALAEIAQPWTSHAGGGTAVRGWRTLGSAPVLHFLHGNGFASGTYWPFLRRFLPEWDLFLHDLEGHGRSDPPPRFSGVASLCRRIPAVIRDQGLDGRPLIGMGHSFGAALTLRTAAENPGLFRALVLLDPIVIPPLPWLGWRAMSLLGLNPMARAARARRTTWPSRQEALDRLRGRGVYAGWVEEALECFVDHAMREEAGQRVLNCPPELEGQIFENPVWPWPAFRAVGVPILFLHGAASYGFLPGAARRARRVNPRVEVATVAGDHCFMQQHPDAAADTVRQFLRSLPG